MRYSTSGRNAQQVDKTELTPKQKSIETPEHLKVYNRLKHLCCVVLSSPNLQLIPKFVL